VGWVFEKRRIKIRKIAAINHSRKKRVLKQKKELRQKEARNGKKVKFLLLTSAQVPSLQGCKGEKREGYPQHVQLKSEPSVKIG